MNQPILGNLHPLIKSIAERNTPALSYLNPQFSDYAEWRKAAHAMATELLRYAPPVVPLDPQVIESVDKGDYIREKITFRARRGCACRRMCLCPKA